MHVGGEREREMNQYLERLEFFRLQVVVIGFGTSSWYQDVLEKMRILT